MIETFYHKNYNLLKYIPKMSAIVLHFFYIYNRIIRWQIKFSSTNQKFDEIQSYYTIVLVNNKIWEPIKKLMKYNCILPYNFYK